MENTATVPDDKHQFEYAVCDEQCFTDLNLPEDLKQTPHLNPIGKRLIYNRAHQAALIPHPPHHAKYPDRNFSLYVHGILFPVQESAQRYSEPGHVEVWFNEGIPDEQPVLALAEAAFELWRYMTHTQKLSIVACRNPVPRIRTVQPITKIISKLNQFCTATEIYNPVPLEIQEFKVLLVAHWLLLPEEINVLNMHLQAHGWNDLNPQAQQLIKKVFAHRQKPQG